MGSQYEYIFTGKISQIRVYADLIAMKNNNLDTERDSHLITLVLSTAAEPTNEINATVQCNYHALLQGHKFFFVGHRG